MIMNIIKKICCCVNIFKHNLELKNKLIHANNDTIPEFSLNGIKTIGKIVDIYDGDTCKIILITEDTLKKFTCRLNFIDCPEIKPLKTMLNREQEIQNAIKARNRLIQLSTNCICNINNTLKKKEIKELLKTNTKIVTVECFDFDKYGRLLVGLFIDNISINNLLIDEKYAKPYYGGKK
jgi:endonuclease YncB( thermonuclease family)